MAYSLDMKLKSIRQIAQEKLQHILYSIPDNRKDLIIEPNLIKSLEHVCGASWLRSNGINKIYKFDMDNIPMRNLTLVYFVSNKLELFEMILRQIKQINQNKPADSMDVVDLKPFHIIVFPQLQHSYQATVEEEGLYGLIELHRFSWDFIMLDTDLLSLEIPNVFRDTFIRMDQSILNAIGQSLRIFQMIFGKPSMILSYGPKSECILEMMNRLDGYVKPSGIIGQSDFTTWIVMDRSKDYASGILTPVIYSGLLLEVFRAESGFLHIDATSNRIKSGKPQFLQTDDSNSPIMAAAAEAQAAAAASNHKNEAARLRMSGTHDSIFQENRYKHISAVVSILSAQSKLLGMEDRNLKDMKITQMQEYVAKTLPKVINQKREIFKHLILCETIVNELGAQFEKLHQMEESMLLGKNKKRTYAKILENLSTDPHQYNSLRHICLLHLTCGLSQEEASGFVISYLNAFGYKFMPIFIRLSKARLFPTIESIPKSNLLSTISIPRWQHQFQIDANKLKLLPNDRETEGNDESASASSASASSSSSGYVFNGSYIPVIAQIARSLLDARKYDEFAMKLMSIDAIKFHRYLDRHNETIGSIGNDIKAGSLTDCFPIRMKTIFIYIVGGITYAEVAACNLIGRMCGAKIVLASDGLMAGGDLIEAVF